MLAGASDSGDAESPVAIETPRGLLVAVLRVSTPAEADLLNAVGTELVVELPDGRSGRALVQKVSGGSRGTTVRLLGDGPYSA